MEKKSFFCNLVLYISAILLFALSSCREDIIVDDTDNNYPVQIRFSDSNGLRKLEWDVVSSTAFRKYILVGSSSPFVTGKVPNKSDNNVSTFVEFTDPKINSHEFIDFPISSVVYYKLYVDVGKRLIESDAIKLVNNIIQGTAFYDKYFYNNDKLYGISISNRQVNTINLTNFNSEFITQFSNQVFFNNQDFVFGVYTSDSEYHFYDLSTFELRKINLSTGVPIQSVFSNGSGAQSMINIGNYLVCAHQSINSALTFWKLKPTLSEFKSFSRTQSGTKRLTVVDSAGFKFIEFSSSLIALLQFNTANNSLTTLKSIIPASGEIQNLLDQVVFSSDKTHFIVSNTAHIYNNNLQNIGKLNCPNCSQFTFSEDNKFIYASSESVNFNFLLPTIIRKYSFPELKLVSTTEIPNIIVQHLSHNKNGLVVGAINGKSFTSNIYQIKI
jgi:hypothetical protein